MRNSLFHVKLEKSEPKRSKKKQVYVPIYLDLPEVHTPNKSYATHFCVFRSAISTDLNLFSFWFYFSFFRSAIARLHTHHQMSLVQPSGEMSAKIREELREPDADAIAKDVAAIREWLEKQPHLPKDMGKEIVEWILTVAKFEHLNGNKPLKFELEKNRQIKCFFLFKAQI